MSVPVRSSTRRGAPLALLGAGVLLTALSGCAADEPSEPPASATASAVGSCLEQGAEHSGWPLDADSTVTSVDVRRDDQGRWAVTGLIEADGETRRFHCTAVPTEDGGARAASWGDRDPG